MQSESKRNLISARVVNKRLLYVTSLPVIMSDINILKNDIYFGRFGEIERIHLGHLGKQSQLCSLFVLYKRQSSCEEAIKTLDDSLIQCMENREKFLYKINCTYGTSKYCLSFIEGKVCTYSKCTFFHELASKSLTLSKNDLSTPCDTVNFGYKKISTKLHDFKSMNENKVVFSTYVNKTLSDLLDSKIEIYDYKMYLDFSVDDWNPI